MKTQRFQRRGIAISPRMNSARLLLLIIITPLVTWYAKQEYTNPYKLHKTVVIKPIDQIPYLHLYQKSIKREVDHIYINLSKQDKRVPTQIIKYYVHITLTDTTMQITTPKDAYESSYFHNSTARIEHQNGVTSIDLGDTTIIIPRKLPTRYYPPKDIMISHATNSEQLQEERKLFTPRATIWMNFSSQKESGLAKNIWKWNKKRMEFDFQRHRNITVSEKIP